MKAILLLLMAAAFCSPSSLRINGKNSPYVLDSLKELDTLYIEPGVSLFCKSGSGFIIRSLFHSVGTEKSRIAFASAEAVPSPFDWNGIVIKEGAIALLVHTKMSNCIDCINSYTADIAIDSSVFTEVGQSCFILKNAPVKTCQQGYFSYNADLRRALQAPKKVSSAPEDSARVLKKAERNSYRKWLIGGLVGAGAAVGAFFLISHEDAPPAQAEEGNTIKYPNLPDL
jgi:hypothetical protein